MRKFTAVLCAAAMTVGLALNVSAGSLSNVGVEAITVSAETAAILPEGKTLSVVEAVPENYKDAKAAEAVQTLNENLTTATIQEIFTILGVPDITSVKTESGATIDLTDFKPLVKFSDLIVTDGDSMEYDINGEVKAVTATVTLEAVKGAKAEDLVLMQINPDNADVHVIEVDEKDFDSEKGDITATFPCMGPFTALEKSE